ncbi:MAG: hypothetical protein IIY02_05445, partial [Firmicutes bacterium]|nr:hypothetical protein [Bacillota bacterium]
VNMQNRLFDYLSELKDNGTTIIIAGRDVEEIAPICNRIAVIENGEITVTPEQFAMENPNFHGDPILPSDEEVYTASDLEKTIVIMPAAEELPAEPEEVMEETPEEVPAEAEAPAEEKETPKEDKEEVSPIKEEKVPVKEYKNITMRSVGFKRNEFEAIGAKVVSEENGKIIMEYSGDLNVLAKLLYDLNMNDIQLSSKELQDVFMPFYEGGENE